MTLRKYKTKIKKKPVEALYRELINVNQEYYTALKLYTQNQSPSNPEKDKKYIEILGRKITIVQKILENKLQKQHHPSCPNYYHANQ